MRDDTADEPGSTLRDDTADGPAAAAEREAAAARARSGQAWREFCDRMKQAGEGLLGDDFPSGDRERAEGFRWLGRLVVHALRTELEAGDPRHPRFVRYETPDNQWGGPNPDNTYLRAIIDPALGYRVHADVRGVRQAILSLHEGDMQLGQLGVYSERSLADLDAPDGRLELVVSPEPSKGNWMPSHPKARLLTVRVFQADWAGDAAPVFHIERIGGEGVPRPPLSPADLAGGLDRAATWVEASAGFWNRYTQGAWARAAVNVAGPARSTPGGADHIRYGQCLWRLDAPDAALLLECDVPDADYWGFTLHTLGWLESGDFGERCTSVNHAQAHVDDDGRVRVVVAHRDPGTPNWIDSEGRREGMLVYRWVWARSAPVPTSRVVAIDELPSLLPATHPRIDPAERRRRLTRRLEAATERFQ